MLKVIQVATPAAKQKFLGQINLTQDSWIVSDLQSREEVQGSLGRLCGHFEGLTVLRASELWSEILKRSFPEYRLAGAHLSKLVLAEFLHQHQQYSSPRATETLFSYVGQLMPLLSHPIGTSLMKEWFEAKAESSMRWRAWFDLSQHAWSYFEEQKLLCNGWASAFLANNWNNTEVWDRKSYFDLGLDIHQQEAELIKNLSSTGEVIVFEPVKASHLQGDHSDRVYDLIRSFADEIIETEPKCIEAHDRSYFRMATSLAEVKAVVNQTRKLLDSGAEPEKIAIVAPRLENYWFCLKSYLDVEGIPVRRSSSVRYSSLLSVQEWLADLRIRVGHLSSSDLELSYYGQAVSPMAFERFRSLFSSIYEAEHFQRDEELTKHFQQEADASVQSRDEFIAFAIRWWPSAADFAPARQIFQTLVQECSAERRFSSEQWVEYVQAIATEQELRIEPSSVRGVYCGDIRSVEHVDADHVFFLGLTATDLNQSQGHQVLAGDVESIARDIGFYLNHPEQDHIEGLVRWLSQCSGSHQVYFFPLTDFEGTEKVPAKFWIKGALEFTDDIEKITSPELTRWDEIRKTPTLSEEASQIVQYDLGTQPRPHFFRNKVSALSASSVESYLRCPFIFAAQKVFKLADEPIADVDFEARGKGLIVHRLFEKLLEPPVDFNKSDGSIRELLDQIAEGEKLNRIEERFWPSFRERLVLLGKRFLEKERQRKSLFPSTSTVGRELDFVFYFDPKSTAISLEAKEGAVKFRGQIDRLDTDERGGAVVYDYKSSKTAKMTHADRWLETDQVQLAIYTMAVESGATGAGAQDVIGAFYYVIKDLTDYYGFRLPEEAGRLFDMKDARRNKLTRPAKEDLLEAIRHLLSETISKMNAGSYQPLPADRTYCERCSWSRVCRAPHLH